MLESAPPSLPIFIVAAPELGVTLVIPRFIPEKGAFNKNQNTVLSSWFLGLMAESPGAVRWWPWSQINEGFMFRSWFHACHQPYQFQSLWQRKDHGFTIFMASSQCKSYLVHLIGFVNDVTNFHHHNPMITWSLLRRNPAVVIWTLCSYITMFVVLNSTPTFLDVTLTDAWDVTLKSSNHITARSMDRSCVSSVPNLSMLKVSG